MKRPCTTFLLALLVTLPPLLFSFSSLHSLHLLCFVSCFMKRPCPTCDQNLASHFFLAKKSLFIELSMSLAMMMMMMKKNGSDVKCIRK
jgi:hypothetical protein